MSMCWLIDCWQHNIRRFIRTHVVSESSAFPVPVVCVMWLCVFSSWTRRPAICWKSCRINSILCWTSWVASLAPGDVWAYSNGVKSGHLSHTLNIFDWMLWLLLIHSFDYIRKENHMHWRIIYSKTCHMLLSVIKKHRHTN